MSRLAAVLLLVAIGCVSPVALEPALLAYDRTVARIETQMMLINIARARHGLPLHWTEVSSIAASFDFRVTSSIGFGLEEIGALPVGELTAALEGTAAESP